MMGSVMARDAERRAPTPILFAHRGGRAHAPENTLEAFRLAVRLGATGLESDVWLTADGVPVLRHDGRVGPRLRRRPIRSLTAAELPSEVPSLADLLTEVDAELPLSLDLKDPEAGPVTIAAVAAAGPTSRLWLCHPEVDVLSGLRDVDRSVRLVHSTRLDRLGGALERHAVDLSAAGLDGVNLPEPDWTGGLVALYRRFDLACLGWDAQHDRQVDRLLALGLDGVFGDHVDRLVDGLARRETGQRRSRSPSGQ